MILETPQTLLYCSNAAIILGQKIPSRHIHSPAGPPKPRSVQNSDNPNINFILCMMAVALGMGCAAANMEIAPRSTAPPATEGVNYTATSSDRTGNEAAVADGLLKD